VAMNQSLAHWLRVLRQVPVWSGGRWRRLPGTLLAWRDAAPFVRLHFLAVATDLGLLEELHHRPATADQLSARLAIGDPALLDAFLHLGAALGELRCRAERWSLHSRRSNALAAPQADTMRAMVQEAIRYDAAVYAGLAAHLGGVPPGDYLTATGAVIARASRLVEPALAPLLRSLVAKRHPRRILDVGCGTGIYLIHAATAGGPELTGLGVDLDAKVVELARRRLADAGLAERFPVRHADVRTAELPAASFDLVLLFQNIYYFAEDERPGLVRRLHELLAPGGALVVASLFAGRSLAAAHYDLLFRATAGCGPLPRRQGLDRQLHDAGFTTTRWVRLIPLGSFHAVVAQR
jgi:4-hydroxy-2,2'-bipyrrole-5-carbaldehyde O-methyltransferase